MGPYGYYSYYSKLISDCEFKKYHGKHFNESWYTYVIDSDKDGYYLSESGERKVLFKFRKRIITPELQELAINSFLQESKKKHSNRGIAAGIQDGQTTARTTTKTGQNEGLYIASNISGYYDRALREHRGLFKTEVACRTTAFTLRNKELWISGLPFIQKCSREYKKLGGKYYNSQKKEYSSIRDHLKIPKTVFTTVTSNYNWRTACHKDSGDYSAGLGNLVVVGKNFSNCYLGFPQFKVLIKIEPGDFLLMDVHQYHCNTPLKTTNNGFRLSFVMYIREDMSKCVNSKKIGNTSYYY
jgi:hypothetical protein